jgi:hypothetical protein
MSAPTAANLARLCELAELCAVVSSAQVCEAHMDIAGHVENVSIRVNPVGCSGVEGTTEFSRTAYFDDKCAGIGQVVRMGELLAEFRAFLAQTYGFSLVRHNGPAFVPPLNLEA